MKKNTKENPQLKLSPLFKVIIECFFAFLISTFCLAYYLTMGVKAHITGTVIIVSLYAFILGLTIFRLAKKLPIAAIMLLIPVIPLAALLTVLALLPLMQLLHG